MGAMTGWRAPELLRAFAASVARVRAARDGRAGTRGRPDASMLLLNNLMFNTLDPGYAEAATWRAARGETGRGRPRLLAGVAMVLVTLLLWTAYDQVQSTRSTSEQARKDLIARIHKGTKQADTLQKDVARLRAEVSAAQEKALQTTASGAQATHELNQLELTTGVAPATGPGIAVTVSDAPKARSDGTGDPRKDTEELGRVLDSDLQRLVNGLWAAGAEAVAINGRRLTPLAAIRSAGIAIQVDYQTLSPPYDVEAIGDPEKLEARFADGPAGRAF